MLEVAGGRLNDLAGDTRVAVEEVKDLPVPDETVFGFENPIALLSPFDPTHVQQMTQTHTQKRNQGKRWIHGSSEPAPEHAFTYQ